MRGIQGKITVVTGGTRGIGKGIAKRFLEEGATVIIIGGKNKADAENAVAELSPLGKIEAMMVDLSEAAAVEKMIDDVVAKYGRIDILVNNAGIQIRKWATEFPIDEFDKVINVNMRAYYIASRCAARYMQKQGGGSIVCTASVVGCVFFKAGQQSDSLVHILNNQPVVFHDRFALGRNRVVVSIGEILVTYKRYSLCVKSIAVGYQEMRPATCKVGFAQTSAFDFSECR